MLSAKLLLPAEKMRPGKIHGPKRPRNLEMRSIGLLIRFSCLFFACWVFIFSTVGECASSRTLVASGSFGAVSTGHPEATATAIKALERGGNAVDAAVAAAFVLGVVDPSNSGLGGDGFALIRFPNGRIEAWDASIIPPKFSQKKGSFIGLPTEPALLLSFLRLHGTIPRPELMAPAIRLAARGFRISAYLEKILKLRIVNLKDPLAILRFAPDGRPLKAGEILVQPELADTLAQIARGSGESFYRGKLASILAKDFRARSSSYTLADLSACAPRAVIPQRLSIGPWTLIGTPPPSSAIVVMALVKALLNHGLSDLVSPDGLTKTIPLLEAVFNLKHRRLSECMRNPRRFFAYMQSGEENQTRTTPKAVADHENTTHLVTWDRHGMIVSMTLTLGRHFGTGEICPLGFFYNNEMFNFSPLVARYPKDYPSDSGPISAKAPLIVLKDDEPVLAIGGAGANRIISNLAIILARFMREKGNLASFVHAPRFYAGNGREPIQEWSPGFPAISSNPTAIASLTHMPAGSDFFGLVSAVSRLGETLIAVGDYHRDGSAGAVRRDPDALQTSNP